jgi:hypothetical protein
VVNNSPQNSKIDQLKRTKSEGTSTGSFISHYHNKLCEAHNNNSLTTTKYQFGNGLFAFATSEAVNGGEKRWSLRA